MSDYVPRLYEAVDQLKAWHQAGRLLFREDVRAAPLDGFPEMLNELFRGRNIGKLVMKIVH